MITIKKIDSLEVITQLKAQYFSATTAPLDGMWHCGFVPMSAHFGFYQDQDLVGYCCVNDDGYLLEFYLAPAAKIQPALIFSQLISQQNVQSQVNPVGSLKGAFVSTAEPDFLSLCLDNSSRFTVNALMYQQNPYQHDSLESMTNISNLNPQLQIKLKMQQVQPNELDNFVQFAVRNIGAPEQWLAGYYANLIQRKELWGYWFDDNLYATGECRLFDQHQTQYADLGMIVEQSQRKKGIATQVMQTLIQQAKKQNLQAIYSTESSNIGA